MKMIYDFSFLTSPLNHRKDTRIAQHFTLGYLNSESGNNFIFRYHPSSLNEVRIDGKELKWAERYIKREGTSYTPLSRIDRHSQHEGTTTLGQATYSIKEMLEMYARHSFWSTVEDAVAIVDWIESVDKQIIDSENQNKVSLIKGERTISDDVNTIVLNRRNIHGLRKEVIREALLQLSISTMEPLNLPKETIQLVHRLYAELNNLRDGMLTHQFFSHRVQTNRQAFYYNQTIVSDLALLPSQHVSFVTFEKNPLKGFIKDDTVKSERNEQIDAHKTDKFRLPSSDDNLSVIHQLVYANEPDKETVWFSHSMIANKTSEDNKEAHAYPHLRILNKEEMIGVKDMDIRILSRHGNEFIRTMSPLFTNHYDDMGSIVARQLHFYDRHGQEGHYTPSPTWVEEKSEKLVKDIILSRDIRFVSRYEKDVLLPKIPRDFDRHGTQGQINKVQYNIERQADESTITNDSSLFDRRESESRVYIDEKQFSKDTRSGQSIIKDVQQMDTKSVSATSSNNHKVHTDLLEYRAQMQTSIMKVHSKSLNSKIVDYHYELLDERRSQEARYDFVDTKVELLPMDARIQYDVSIKVDKIRLESWIIHAFTMLSSLEKASMIVQHQELFDAIAEDAFQWNEQVYSELRKWEAIQTHDLDLSEYVNKAAKNSMVSTGKTSSNKSQIDSLKIELLLSDPQKLEAYFRDMVVGDRPDILESIIQEYILGHEPERYGHKPTREERKDAQREEIYAIVEKALLARKKELQRQAVVPDQQYVFVGDISDWEDIWKRYSPGVDVIDVPSSDFDYSKLANQVYNEKTGVPYKPLSPTNVPDVRVKTPLHHPLPQFQDVGTEEVVVDNYVIIDTILAIESLKNRDKLRYAGMPAEKALQQLLAKLWTWIQQAAPGNQEYIRMFRMARWYMEHAIIKVSEHILHREYESWKSTLHKGQDLGIPYTATGWVHYPSSYILQTNSTSSRLSFHHENYIDSQFKIRGYFDNPLGEGTMEVKVDGEVIDTITSNGSFDKTYELPMGKHHFELVFNGSSGRVSLSSVEVGGSVFIRAWTTSDDSNSNGLKAATLLVQMLLVYFEKHHGDYKKKGNMIVKQRKMWQST